MSSSTTLQSIGGTAGSGIRRFSKLDLDIWFMILDLISDKSFLRRLSHVCKHFRQAVSKRLYETLELVATEKPVRRKFPYAFYDDFKDGGPPNHLCQHVVHLHVTAPFQKVLAKRCFHHIRPDYNQIEEAHRVQDRSLKWSDLNLFPLIAQIPKNQLRSLRLDLGTCMPWRIFDWESPVNERQNHLEEISIISEPYCADMNFFNLNVFNQLKKFSWRGIQSSRDFEVLKRNLNLHSDRLEELTLEIGEFQTASSYFRSRYHREEEYTIMPSSILPPSGDDAHIFPVLTSLTLIDFGFHRNHAESWLKAVDFGELKVLRLQFCWHIYRLQQAILDANITMHLQTFELIGDWGYGVSPWIRQLGDLRNCYLLLSSSSTRLWNAIQSHLPTLEKLVVHLRNAIHPIDEPFPFYDKPFEADEVPFSNRHDAWSGQSNIECMGVMMDPLELLRCIYSASKTVRPKWKLLHLRRSGGDTHRNARQLILEAFQVKREARRKGELKPELESLWGQPDWYWDLAVTIDRNDRGKPVDYDLFEFVEWAFGASGLPELEVVAFGDFCYNGRYRDSNILFGRRRKPGSRKWGVFDIAQLHETTTVADPLDFLTACPADRLILPVGDQRNCEHRFPLGP